MFARRLKNSVGEGAPMRPFSMPSTSGVDLRAQPEVARDLVDRGGERLVVGW
jgi:hypothetical protein